MKFNSIIVALSISAGAALIYQVTISNILFYYYTENSYSVATVLSTFLFGLALGAFLYHKFQAHIEDEAYLFGWLQITVALYAIFIFYNAVDIIPRIDASSVYLVSFLMLLIPTTAFGISFPVALAAVKDINKSGLIYGADLVGAAIGSLLAGFFLLPLLGNQKAILVAVALGVLSAAFSWRGWYRVCAGVLFCALAIYISTQIAAVSSSQVASVHLQEFSKPSPYGEVVIKEGTLFIDGRDECSWLYGKDATERTIVDQVFEHIQKSDARVLNIGLGCGLTLEQILLKTNETVDVVEINPVVVEANQSQTDLLKNPAIELIVADGIQYLSESSKRYDAIISDITNPAVIYSSNLFTKETFADAHTRLVEGGIFGLWVNRCDSGLYNDIIFNTLAVTFENVYQLNQNTFIASDRILPYQRYVAFTDTNIVNTKDTNHLAREYYEQCRFGNDSEYYVDFE